MLRGTKSGQAATFRQASSKMKPRNSEGKEAMDCCWLATLHRVFSCWAQYDCGRGRDYSLKSSLEALRHTAGPCLRLNPEGGGALSLVKPVSLVIAAFAKGAERRCATREDHVIDTCCVRGHDIRPAKLSAQIGLY